MNKYFVLLTVCCLATASVFATDTLRVRVNAAKETGKLRRAELYNNNSLLRTPSDAIVQKYKKEIGTARIMRCWVTLEDYWNATTDQYNYDFKCGWDLNLWDSFYNYMARFSDMSEEILLNVRGYHKEVVENKISMQQWRTACKNGIKHYKERYPKIKYIEALNEYELSSFGGLTNEYYYRFYQQFYDIINEINAELNPAIPLLVGGPCVVEGLMNGGGKEKNMRFFLQSFAQDKNPSKKLDFISYHEYGSAANPASVADHEARIDGLCRSYGLPTNLPIMVNEMGPFAGTRKNGCLEEDQLVQAAAMNSLFYFFNQQPDLQAFHWVIQHKTNERKNQIYDNLRWSPYGMLLKLQARTATNQLETDAPKLAAGKGVYTLAAKDEQKITVMVWNYQWTTGRDTHTVNLNIDQLPLAWQGKKVIIREFLLDSKTNNIHSGYNLFTKFGEDQLAVTKESNTTLKNNLIYITTLLPNASSLVEITLATP